MADSSSETPTLDLAQRIAAALSCTDEPRPNPSDVERRESDIMLGTVPVHLRHLHNLLVDSDNRRDDEVLNGLFWNALDTHLDNNVRLHKKKLMSDWTVIGVPDDGRPRHDGGLGDVVMIQIGGGPAERGGGILEALFGGRRPRRH